MGQYFKGWERLLVLNPQMATFSGICILLTVLGINLLGDGLRDALDPKMKV